MGSIPICGIRMARKQKTQTECDQIKNLLCKGEKKTMTNKEIVARNITLNYQAIIGPRNYGGDRVYSTVIMIAKSDDALLSEISDAIDDVIAKASEKGGKFENLDDETKEKIAIATLHDADAEGNEAMANHYYLRVSSKTKPLVIDLDGQNLTGIDDVYDGVIASVVFKLYAYAFTPAGNGDRKYGIKGELIGVVKVNEGERINNTISATTLLDKVMNKSAQSQSVDSADAYNNPFDDGDTNE
ncbi:ssDNA-binding protein [Enterococcus sp. DIV0187]|uniref:ssDNA-binding protein n=1 Tax=Enterococcus sp. DIV0187 TaxID=2774644 RepID=UPI003F20DE34